MTIPGSDGAAGAAPAPQTVDDAPIVRAAGALSRTGDFGVVVLGTAGRDPVTLAGTGVEIWDALARPRRRSELLDLLAARFSTDRSRIAHDIEPVIDALLADGVLEVAS